jgi:hypothetical protein
MQMDRIEPTPEMLAFYERRTAEYIERPQTREWL